MLRMRPRRPCPAAGAITRRAALLALPALAPAMARAQALEVTLNVPGGRLELQLDDELPAAVHADAAAWVERSALAVARWLGRFPVQQTEVLLQAVDGTGVQGGTTFAEPAPYVRIRLGRHTRAAHLANDGVLVHEFLHLAVPRLAAAHQWLNEGLATYGEGLVRVHAGQLDAPRWWGQLVRGLPQGQPAAGDAGLDHTPTWGRTYWGGAGFCLQADLALRQRQVAVGLRQAWRGVVAAGGNHAVAWPVAKLLKALDDAVGTHVWADLYAQHRDQAVPIDLPALWQALGIAPAGDAPPRLALNGPQATLRRAMAA